MRKLKIKQNLFISLQAQLAEFGLNPRDWQIRSRYLNPKTLDLHHQHDKSFRLAGAVGSSNSTVFWRQLAIKSL